MRAPLNGLSIDVEDWWHVLGTAENDDPADWDRRAGVMEPGTDAALELLEEHGVRGTFFFLGWAARHRPALVRRVAEAGHEIGVHGDVHRLVSGMGEEEFRQDLRRARASVEDAAGPIRRSQAAAVAPAASSTPLGVATRAAAARPARRPKVTTAGREVEPRRLAPCTPPMTCPATQSPRTPVAPWASARTPPMW